MLYLLTGDVEIGKTTWLKQVVRDARAADVPLAGYISPAVFEEVGGVSQKTAIDCVMLPEERCVRIGWRADLARGAGIDDAQLHKSALGLRWVFDDAVMEELNTRLSAYDAERPAPGLLLVDELGFLEFQENTGVTEAMRVLDGGFYRDAIATMRPALLDEARERWLVGAGGADQVQVIAPGYLLKLVEH